MGRDKALLPWPPVVTGAASNNDQTLLTASIAALLPFAESVIVVAGANAAQLAPFAARYGAIVVENPAPERGQFSSLQVGLSELVARGYGAAMITLVDCPPLSSASLQKLSEAFAHSLGKWGVQPENSGRHGHPLLANRALIDAFLTAPIASNARAIKHHHAQLIDSIPVSDALLTIDVNTPEQYAALAPDETSKL